MKLTLPILCVMVPAIMGWMPVAAQTGNHTVRVSVATITALQVSGGTVTLNITGAGVVAGQDLMTSVDQSTSLLWGINSSNKKVTVQTSLAAPTFALKIEAVNPTQGMSTGEIALSSTPQDFLLNIGRSSGTCTIRYRGEALASQGVGSDAHSITFTVATQ